MKRVLAAGFALLAPAFVATPAWARPSTTTVTVDGRAYPVCQMEDCSDQPGQIGVWFDVGGNAWLSVGDHSVYLTPMQPAPDEPARAPSGRVGGRIG